MGLSFWHLLLVLLVVMVLFGPGRLSGLMGDVGKGIRNLREGMKDDDPKQLPPSEKDKA